VNNAHEEESMNKDKQTISLVLGSRGVRGNEYSADYYWCGRTALGQQSGLMVRQQNKG